MSKLFVSGSKSISTLSEDFISALKEVVAEGSEILVGDCYGVDSAVQKLLAEWGYSNVTVYCSGETPRNYFLKEGRIRSCAEAAIGLKGRAYNYVKDIAMCNDCDNAMMFWNGISRGTLQNIRRVREAGKPMTIFRV